MSTDIRKELIALRPESFGWEHKINNMSDEDVEVLYNRYLEEGKLAKNEDS